MLRVLGRLGPVPQVLSSFYKHGPETDCDWYTPWLAYVWLFYTVRVTLPSSHRQRLMWGPGHARGPCLVPYLQQPLLYVLSMADAQKPFHVLLSLEVSGPGAPRSPVPAPSLKSSARIPRPSAALSKSHLCHPHDYYEYSRQLQIL